MMGLDGGDPAVSALVRLRRNSSCKSMRFSIGSTPELRDASSTGAPLCYRRGTNATRCSVNSAPFTPATRGRISP